MGSPLALYLAAAGVWTLGLADFDAVDETNLHRQILHGTPKVGRPKLEAAAVELLRASGFGRARNLTGGLDRWRGEVDPGLPPA